MHPFRLRPATLDDHPTFARLFVDLATGDAVPDVDRFAQMLGETRIVEDERGPVGYVHAQSLEGSGYVRHLVVDPAFRRRGVARFALTSLAARFRAEGCTRWCLNVKPDNAAARALYASLGMALVHASRIVRLTRADEERLPPGDAVAHVLGAHETSTFEDTWKLPRGLLAASAATGRILLGSRSARGEPGGLAAFDPGFPGAFPFRARDAAHARALLDACRTHRVALEDDPERPWRAAGVQVVTEADPALADRLVAAGGEVVLETLHYAGDL